MIKKIILVYLYIIVNTLNAQQFLSNNYNTSQYKSHPIMWAMTQDFNGRIWFANNNGVVRFDGNNWNTFKIPYPVRNLVFNNKGDLFLACKGNFGLLKFKQDGTSEYISLNSTIEKNKINGDEKIFAIGDDIYFSSRTCVIKIFYTDNEYKTKIIETKTILGSFDYNGGLYLNIAKEGLGFLNNSHFNLIKNGDLLLGKQISSVTNWNNKLIISTSYDGLFILENNSVTKIEGIINSYTKDGIAGICVIKNNIYLGTFHKGVIVFKDFNNLYYANTIPNLPSNEIYYLSSDNENNLWIAHSKGLTHVLINEPLKKINTISSDASITNLEKLNDDLFISTLNGVIKLNKETFVSKKIAEINGECWDLEEFKNRVYVASTNGLYQIENDQVKLILANETILHLQKNQNTLYALGENGCWVIDVTNGNVTTKKINGINEMCNSIYKNTDGNYWLGTYSNGLKKINDPHFNYNIIPNSLKTGEVKIKYYLNELLFINNDSVYNFKNNVFEINSNYSGIFKNIKSHEFDLNITSCFYTETDFKCLKNGGLVNSKENFFSGKPTANLLDNKFNWVAVEEQLYKIENENFDEKVPQLNINIINNFNKTFYSGFDIDDNGIVIHKQEFIPSIDYNETPIKIEFAASSFLNSNKNKYRYKIIGLNENWSDWSNESFVVLNGINGGNYALMVEAKNAYGVLSKEIEFKFKINPPIYLSSIAYIIYICLIVLLVYFIFTLYSKQLLKKNKILESKVLERTKELEIEKQVSEDLLLNILPSNIVNELKQTGKVEAKLYNHVTVLFTDFVNFTGISQKLTPQELVGEIHKNFVVFDEIIEKNGLEKIKTIGDAYLAVCGLPITSNDHALKVIKAALEIREYVVKNKGKFQIRIGINSGPVIAGIVGNKKYAYDIWGDTVNTAARMEQNSESGKINISGETYNLVKNNFTFEYRGKIAAKNKGDIDMYFVS